MDDIYTDENEIIQEEVEEDTENPSTGDVSIENILASLLEMQPEHTESEPSSAQNMFGGRTIRLNGFTLRNLSRILGSGSGRVRIDEDDDEDYRNDYATPKKWFPVVSEPQAAGLQLLLSGEFGRISNKIASRRSHVSVTKLLNNGSSRRRHRLYKEDISADLIPNSNGVAVASYESNVYCGQFSAGCPFCHSFSSRILIDWDADSSFFYTCSQDFRMHVYDTTAPPVRHDMLIRRRRTATGYNQNLDVGHESTMKVIKTIEGRPGRWTITDSHLSPNNEKMIYSSITPTVYMTSTLDSSLEQHPICFSDPSSGWREGDASIWSCRFSADGNEVIAGGSSSIYVYDLLADRRTVKIVAHSDDVNSCCWADTASGNVLISASDDSFVKVWDRRSLGSSPKPSGVLIGHTEGVTNVSAKGDGRYVISNGKDQALRLWDLRKMRSSAEFDAVANDHYGSAGFDYRYGRLPRPKYAAHPKDCSVMTYRGHSVMRTLIRCNFSPSETTGSQYIYSGSADGKIHIWSLDGRIVQVLDRSWMLPMSFDPSAPEPKMENRTPRKNICVRDVSWHSQEPVMLSAGWDGDRGGSTVARHEWKGLSKLPGGLEDWVEKKSQEKSELSGRRSMRQSLQQFPGSYDTEEDDDEDYIDG